MTTTPKPLNGVNTTQLDETIAAIRLQPELGMGQFRSTGRWIEGGHNRTMIEGYYAAGQEHERREPFVLDKDEPPVLLGRDLGPNPAEYLLAALAGCTTTSMVYHAAANGIEIESLETSLEGEIDLRGFLKMDETVRNGFQGIRLRFKVKTDADEATLREYLKRSPMYDAITNPTPVTIEIEKA